MAGFVEWAPYVLMGIILLMLIIVIYLVIALRRSLQAPAAAPEATAPTASASDTQRQPATMPKQLQQSFMRSIGLLKTMGSGRQQRYRAPWLLLLGETASGKTAIMNQLDLRTPLEAPQDERAGTHAPCNWYFFNQGVVLDVAGQVIAGADRREDRATGWQTLMRLLRRHRPKRPIDGVILTIAAPLLLESNTEAAPAALKQRATHVYNKLWQLQQQLGMRLPIYILVTKCDELPGFTSLSRNLPTPRRYDIVGWSNPYTLDTAYLSTWVDEAFQQLQEQLFNIQIDIYAAPSATVDADNLFLLPAAMQRLLEPLRLYLDQLFTQNIYHESFFFRGLYLSGDGGADMPMATELVDVIAPTEDAESAIDTVATHMMPEEAPAAATSPLPVASIVASPKPVFIRHLFESKIFPEFGLAQPITQRFVMANRWIWLLQALLVVIVVAGGLGLWQARARLWRTEPQITRNLDVLKTQMRRMNTSIKAHESKPPKQRMDELSAFTKTVKNQALDTIHTMNRIPRRDLWRLSLPPSWLGFVPELRAFPLDHAVTDVIAVAYNRVVLRAMFYDLASRAEDLAHLSPLPQETAIETFQRYSQQLHDLQTDYQSYNQLRDPKALKHFLTTPPAAHEINQAMIHVFGEHETLPEAYFNSKSFYRHVIQVSQADPNAPPIFNPEFATSYVRCSGQACSGDNTNPYAQKARMLAENYYATLFKPNPILEALQASDTSGMAAQINHLSQASNPDISTAINLSACINHTRGLLAAPEWQWVAQPVFHRTEDFEAALQEIKDSIFLDNENSKVIERIRRKGDKDFNKLKTTLSDYQQSDVLLQSGLLDLPPKQQTPPVLKLSEEVTNLETHLNDWLRQPFLGLTRATIDQFSKSPCQYIGSPTPRTNEQINLKQPARGYLTWPQDKLTDIQKLITQYQNFLDKLPESFPPELQSPVETLSFYLFEAEFIQQLNREQRVIHTPLYRYPPEDALRASAQSFQDVHPALTQMETALAHAGLHDVSDDLTSLTVRMAFQLLRDADAFFEQHALYTPTANPAQLANAQQSLAARLFEVRDKAALQAYLTAQRQRLLTIANQYVAPALSVLSTRASGSGAVPSALLRKWQRLRQNLDAYAQQTPGNILSQIEKLVLDEFEQTTENCKVQPPVATERGYLAQKYQTLRLTFNRECRDDKIDIGSQRYLELARAFNQTLAGRFPFARSRDNPALTASPDNLHNLYKLYDPYLDLMRNALNMRQAKRALTFLQHLQDIRKLFAPFIDGNSNEVALSIGVYFRMLPFSRPTPASVQLQDGTDQILNWQLQIGDPDLATQREVRYQGPRAEPLQIDWRFGEPVRFNLQWAKNAEVEPVLNGQKAVYLVDDRTAIYDYTGPWAMLRFLRHARNSDADHWYALPFTIYTRRTQNNGAAASRTQPTSALVYVGLLAPESQQQLKLPLFPARAPGLDVNTSGQRGRR